jgi:acetyl-CoA acyltransferase
MFDTTIGWRFVNPLMKKLHGTDAMPETAENLADELKISRADQDAFALRSQQRAVAAQAAGRFDDEIVPVEIAQKKGEPKIVAPDEHPRADTSLEKPGEAEAHRARGRHGDGRQRLGRQRRRLRRAARLGGGSETARPDAARAHRRHGHGRRAAAHHGHRPGAGDAQAAGTHRTEARRRWTSIELNEAFAAQALAVTRDLGLPDDAPQVNPNGGAIAPGPPARHERRAPGHDGLDVPAARDGGRYALCTMCIGVGQGIALSSSASEMPFPCADIDAPEFEIRRELTLDEVLDYLRTWSSTQRCLKETGVDPCLALRARLQELWPTPESRKTIVWPIILRCGRVE